MAHNFQQAGFDVRHPRIARYLDLCLRMRDLPRHLGQHSGGMVICAGMLNSVVPIERASMPGRTVIQWDKEDCADMGLIKVDLLGLGMMAVLKDSIELIPRHYKKEIDLAALPEDPVVYETLCKADTVGMFQVESRAQMASIPHNAPTHFYDLVVQVAIIRPGPIVGKMMHPYMRRRQGKEEVTYPHPSLEPVLKRTLGVPLFQEQLLRMAMTVASFTGAEAEELRRAVGMRRSMQRMKDLEGRLRSGMTRNGIGPEAQDNIVQGISSFAMYGFPESHAASFALIAYASAYLKVHYLAAFTCGLLNNQPMGFYSPAVLIKDAQRHVLRVRPIDVQLSEWLCGLEQPAEKGDMSCKIPEKHPAGAKAPLSYQPITARLKPCPVTKPGPSGVFPQLMEDERNGSLSLRVGLNYVKGLRQSSAEAILAARGKDGPFASVDQLAARVPELNRKELVALARVGALNSLDAVEHRRDALWQVEQAGRPVGPLLRGAADPGILSKPLKRMTTDERLTADYSGTGITTGPHPMAFHRERLSRQGYLSAEDLAGQPGNQWVRIAGRIISRQRPGTAKGFVFLSLEDETGIANIILTPDVFEQNRLVATRSRFLSVAGKLQNQDSVVHVKAQSIASFSEATDWAGGLDDSRNFR
jgi:error-prone DNA polymerase